MRVSKWHAVTTQDIEHIEQKEIREGAVWSSKGQIRLNLIKTDSYFCLVQAKGTRELLSLTKKVQIVLEVHQ